MEAIRLFNLVLLLFILLLSSEMLVRVGAYECEYRSANFTGVCFQRNKECYASCQQEGFERGSCKGLLLRRCICTKSCESPGQDVPPPSPPEEDVPPPPEEDVPPSPEEDVPPPSEEDVPPPPEEDVPPPEEDVPPLL